MKVSVRLLLTEHQRHQIIDEASAGRPNEVCGLLSGHWQQDQAIVRTVIPLVNVSPTPCIRYQVDPTAFIAAYHLLERRGDELIGIYHSHPLGAAIPSATDLAEATWPEVFYLIVGFTQGAAPDLQAWTLRHNTAVPVESVTVPDQG